MFEALAVVISMVLFCAGSVICFHRFFEYGSRDLQAWGIAAVLVWSMAWALDKMVEYETAHPCAAYETRMTYNAATKTPMPMRVCVERGEWITEQTP